MIALGEEILATEVIALVGGLAYGAVADWREREVTDRLWQVLGILGLVLGAVTLAPGGSVALALWVLIAAFALEHMFPWSLGTRFEQYDDLLDLAIYVGVILVVLAAIARFGIGGSAVPAAVIAVLVSVVFARLLFEAGILYGGADAKAIIIAAVLVPLFPSPLLIPTSLVPVLTGLVPFAMNVLIDTALLSLVVPLGIFLLNVSRGEARGWKAFTGYSLPVGELPHRFVWVRNPMFGEGRTEEEAIETSEQDRHRRERIARELTERGVDRTWVTPQIPYLVLIAAGVVVALLLGNLLFDLLALL